MKDIMAHCKDLTNRKRQIASAKTLSKHGAGNMIADHQLCKKMIQDILVSTLDTKMLPLTCCQALSRFRIQKDVSLYIGTTILRHSYAKAGGFLSCPT